MGCHFLCFHRSKSPIVVRDVLLRIKPLFLGSKKTTPKSGFKTLVRSSLCKASLLKRERLQKSSQLLFRDQILITKDGVMTGETHILTIISRHAALYEIATTCLDRHRFA